MNHAAVMTITGLVVITYDIVVDVKCEIMLSNHNKSRHLCLDSDANRDSRPTNHS